MKKIKNVDEVSLSGVVIRLVEEVNNIKKQLDVATFRERRIPIGIDAACEIMGKEKPTLYSMVRKGLIPCYKNGKKLYFYEDELIGLINSGKKIIL